MQAAFLIFAIGDKCVTGAQVCRFYREGFCDLFNRPTHAFSGIPEDSAIYVCDSGRRNHKKIMEAQNLGDIPKAFEELCGK